jgi:preprotein translocase subunit YajC
MKIALKFGVIAGLLIAVAVFFGGCLVPATPTTPGGTTETNWFSQYGMIIILVAIFAVIYFLTIRPQRRRQKEQQEMMQNLQKGDRVITAGGIYGTIDSLSEDTAVIKVEGGTTLRVARGSLAVRRDEQQQQQDRYTGKR